MLVTEHLRRVARRHPERIAFSSRDARLTYAETEFLVDRVAAGLQARGCRSADPVAVLSPNDARAFGCMLAILRSGAAWVPVNHRNTARANAEFLRSIGCRWLFWHGALAADVAVIVELLGPALQCIRIDGDTLSADSVSALLVAGATLPPEGARDLGRICTIVGTGGTTGLPKGVAWTESTWNALLATAWAEMPCEVPPVHLCVAPMTHAAGVLAMMLMPGGPTHIVLDRADPHEIMSAIAEHRVTHLYLPPTLLYLMLAHPEVRRFDYASLRYFLITAAPVSPARLREAVAVFGPVMAQCFGQAEAPMVCTFFGPRDIAAAAEAGDEARLASCGRPTLLTEVGVVDARGALLPDGEAGEIVVRGDLVMRGYLTEAAGAPTATGGWHRTGDIGRIDPDGFVYLIDRQKDMIISGGFNVYPAEIERLLMTHPAVHEAAVIGVPDEKWGEAVKAIVQLKEAATVTEEDLLRYCRRELGGVKTPKSIEFRAALPRSAVGKVLKRSLREPYWVGESRAV